MSAPAAGAMTLYLASPFGFSECGRDFYYGRFVPLIESARFVVVDPWRLADADALAQVASMPYSEARQAAWTRLDFEIADRNRRAIDAADGLVAVLDGTEVDSGTAAEIGYAFGRGKRIVGYRGDTRLAGDNEGAVINLQVEYFIAASGGEIVNALVELPAALARAFAPRPL